MGVEVEINFSVTLGQAEHHENFDLGQKRRSEKWLDDLSATGFKYLSSIYQLRFISPLFLSWSVEIEIEENGYLQGILKKLKNRIISI